MYKRLIEDRVRIAMNDTPVVAINGPRQSGKTTLVKAIVTSEWRYLTLDDQTVLEAANSNPVGFVRDLDRAVIDEIQRAPALMLALKQSIDADRRPGRFLITGSANVLTMPSAQESLAGRIEVATLLPLSQAELARATNPALLAALFEGEPLRHVERGATGEALIGKVLAGGYPEVLSRDSESRRLAWCRQYLDAIVQRDLADLAPVEKPVQARRLIDALAIQIGQLTNFSDLGGKLGLSSKTVANYLDLLEQLFIVRRVEAWHRNALKRLVKTPKLHFRDTGLVAASRRLTLVKVKADRTMFGAGTLDEASKRRSIYFTVKRSQLFGSMVAFDQPEPLVSQGSRPTTTVTPQALMLMNGPQVREWAEALASRVEREASDGARIARAYVIAIGRPPHAGEAAAARAFVAAQTGSYAAEGKPNAAHIALADFAQVIFGLNDFAYVE